MQNAHLRLGRLEYVRQAEVTNTHVSLHVDRYVGDGEQAHLLSVFGGDAEVGAIRAAIYEEHAFHLTFPNRTNKTVKLGPDANCYNGSLSIGAKRTVRHLVAVSAALQANGSAGVTYLMHLDVETKKLALRRGQDDGMEGGQGSRERQERFARADQARLSHGTGCGSRSRHPRIALRPVAPLVQPWRVQRLPLFVLLSCVPPRYADRTDRRTSPPCGPCRPSKGFQP
jgi:hypothetical protein